MSNSSQLPIELKLIIFSHLDLKQLMNCRLVSKHWRNCVDQFRFKELAIVNTESDQLNNTLYNKFHSYESLNHQNLFEPSNLVIFKQALSNQLFKNLEYLNISYYIDWRAFNIETLNQFNRLEQLDITIIEVLNRSYLNLPNLNKLCILEVVKAENEDNFIEFNCPKLQIVRCNEDLNVSIKILKPYTVKNLQVNLNSSDLSSFLNLEIYQHNFALNLDHNILSILPDKLKQLHLYNLVKGTAFERIKNLLSSFIDQRIKLKRYDLIIYFMGIKLIDGKSLNEYDFGFNYYKSHMKYYHLLSDRLPFFNQIDYDVLTNSKHEIPNDFFIRFNNIQILSAINVQNQIKFIQFLSNCPHLIELNIQKSSLDSNFYVQLPKLCSLLKLKIEKQSISIDYEFISKFKKLIEFQTNQFNSITQIHDSFIKCKYLKKFQIITSSKRIDIIKKLKNSFSFSCVLIDLNNNIEANQFDSNLSNNIEANQFDSNLSNNIEANQFDTNLNTSLNVLKYNERQACFTNDIEIVDFDHLIELSENLYNQFK